MAMMGLLVAMNRSLAMFACVYIAMLVMLACRFSCVLGFLWLGMMVLLGLLSGVCMSRMAMMACCWYMAMSPVVGCVLLWCGVKVVKWCMVVCCGCSCVGMCLVGVLLYRGVGLVMCLWCLLVCCMVYSVLAMDSVWWLRKVMGGLLVGRLSQVVV